MPHPSIRSQVRSRLSTHAPRALTKTEMRRVLRHFVSKRGIQDARRRKKQSPAYRKLSRAGKFNKWARHPSKYDFRGIDDRRPF